MNCLKTVFTPFSVPTGNPAGSETFEPFGNSVVSISISSTSYQDDDLAVKINNTAVKDTQLNVGWYNGATQIWFPPSTGTKNASFSTTGFRQLVLTEDDFLSPLGRLPRQGDIVDIFTFDGWRGLWRTSPWIAEVRWTTGKTIIVAGGKSSSGSSPVVGPHFTTPGYHDTGPWFANYIPNGKIYL